MCFGGKRWSVFDFVLRASLTGCGMKRMPTYWAVFQGDGSTKQLGISRPGSAQTEKLS